MTAELTKLLDKKIILPSDHEPGEYISRVFLRENRDGSRRMILNLNSFHNFVEGQHFKIETLDTVLNLLTPGAYAGSLDLKSAYNTIAIHDSHTKYLKFFFAGKHYRFVALPNGLKSGPRLFTKLLRVVFSALRRMGLESSYYLDDAYLQGNTFDLCKTNILTIVRWLGKFGFVIHPIKSVFYPTQKLTHVDFQLNLEAMTITLPPEKAQRVKACCDQLLATAKPTIRDVARVIGSLVACFPAVPHGKLHYRNLELDKIEALVWAKGRYSQQMTLKPRSLPIFSGGQNC